jgi:hypothetical protein
LHRCCPFAKHATSLLLTPRRRLRRRHFPHCPFFPFTAERKSKLRQAQGDAKREIDEFRAQREARLRTVQPEAEALAAKVARLAGETDRKIAALEAEYQRNKEPVLQLLMQIVMSIDNPHAERK